jgi:hypothetical protein
MNAALPGEGDRASPVVADCTIEREVASSDHLTVLLAYRVAVALISPLLDVETRIDTPNVITPRCSGPCSSSSDSLASCHRAPLSKVENR